MKDSDHALISLIYQSATDPSLWPDVPELLAKCLGTHQAILGRSEAGSLNPADIVTYGIDHVVRQKYLDILDDDPWFEGMNALPSGVACFGDQFLTLSEVKRTPFFELLCKPSDVAHMGGGIVRNESDTTYMFAVQRNAAQGIFRPEELNHIQRLMGHFDRARIIALQVRGLRQSMEALRGVMNKSPYGTFLVDESGLVCWCNSVAEKICQLSDGLTLRLKRLVVNDVKVADAIYETVDGAIRTSKGQSGGSGDYFALRRPSGKRPYQLTVSPLSKRDSWGAGAFAVVFVLDPDDPPELSASALRSLYQLTNAEARVARALTRGFSVNEVADRFEVSTNTVRTQLKAILRKCDVKSQAELLQLFARSVW